MEYVAVEVSQALLDAAKGLGSSLGAVRGIPHRGKVRAVLPLADVLGLYAVALDVRETGAGLILPDVRRDVQRLFGVLSPIMDAVPSSSRGRA